ncbi:MAG TPA: aminotransferase class III-fold pyridoxal phosphate-dependent enzyme [Thermomicrobiales bacterium]|nr:aminotransferase class III-fold pyridoxal phosphate-dependent enzyme [Thermomicrobiales bacterium]
MAAETSVGIDAQLTERAARVLPGPSLGTFMMPAGRPFVAARGAGSKIFDVDGNAWIDYVLGSGPLILGHAHPAVVAAVGRQAALGSQFYALNELIIQLAERMVAAIPCAEKVKFSSTGSEATFLAMRLARAATGRDKILKFEGGYHGHSDYAVVAYAPRRGVLYPVAPPDSAGVPQAAAGETLVAPFNDADLATELIERYRDELAAVIVEPMQRMIPPRPGFLAALRRATAANNVLLIFDEVVTGFRLAWGGAQEHYGVVPDLACYGKTIGGGYPISAVCGPAAIMDLADPRHRDESDYVYFSGTFNGNPVAAAAGLATLDELARPGVYDRLRATALRLATGLEAAIAETGAPAQVLWDGPIVTVLFTDRPVVDYRSAQAVDRARQRRWNAHLLDRGLLVNPVQQKWYLSTAHDDADIQRTIEIARAAFAAAMSDE